MCIRDSFSAIPCGRSGAIPASSWEMWQRGWGGWAGGSFFNTRAASTSSRNPNGARHRWEQN
eukprot:15387971-Alexandrium_andersonii.AAC.1